MRRGTRFDNAPCVAVNHPPVQPFARDRGKCGLFIKMVEWRAGAAANGRPVAVGSVEGNEAEKRRITGLSTADIVDRAVGEEIDRMPFEHFLLVILDHQVATEADRMAMWEGYPVIIVCRGLPGLAKVIFADQRGVISGCPQPARQGRKFADCVPVLRPAVGTAVIKPGVDAMRRWHQPGEHRCPAGRAHGIDAKRAVKAGAGGGNPVEMRGMHLGIAIASQHIGRLVVCHDQNDVRAPGHASHLAIDADGPAIDAI